MTQTVQWGSRPSYLIAALGADTQIRFAQLLAPMGLLPQHFGVLRQLSALEGVTQQDIADSLRLRRAAMVGLVDELEQQGLVERRRHPVDRRANALHLTSAGRRMLAQIVRAAQALDDELMAHLPPDTRAAFLEGLGRLAVATGVADGVFPTAPDAAERPQGRRTG